MKPQSMQDLPVHIGLPINALFGLILSATAIIFGPFVALQSPAPGSYVMWGATVVMTALGLALTFKACGPTVIVASIRKRPRFWLGMGVQFVLAVGMVLGFVGLLNRIFG